MDEDYLGQKLCIFISKNDKYEGIVLYELLLEIAFNSRLSGGTVTIGDKGFFGAQDESTKLKILRSSENLPVVLEFQGRGNRIDRYIERIRPMIKDGLLTRTDVRITKFNATDDDADNFEDQKNEDQSKIFDEDNPVSNTPESKQEYADETMDDDADDSVTSDYDVHDEATSTPEDNEQLNSEFLEPDEHQKMEVDIDDTPDLETPSFDDDVVDTTEPSGTDPEKSSEDEENETPDLHIEGDSLVEGEGDKSETPDFELLDDDQNVDNAEEEVIEIESDPFIEEDEEDAPVLQLGDLSETQDEDGDEKNLDMDDLHESDEDTSDKTEFAESQTDDELDELFDKTNKNFESNFDDMLKQAGEASEVDVDLDSENEKTADKEHEESPADEADEAPQPKSKNYDKNHTEDDMKDYFSSLFKK